MAKRKLRSDSTKHYLNPATGRILSVQGTKERAWSALSKYVRKIEPYCCTCGAPSEHAGHWKHNTEKTNKQLGGNMLWYDIRNIHGQCNQCNSFRSSNPVQYALFMEEKYGHGIMQELYRLYNTPKKWTIPEILEIERTYKQKLSNLETV